LTRRHRGRARITAATAGGFVAVLAATIVGISGNGVDHATAPTAPATTVATATTERQPQVDPCTTPEGGGSSLTRATAGTRAVADIIGMSTFTGGTSDATVRYGHHRLTVRWAGFAEASGMTVPRAQLLRSLRMDIIDAIAAQTAALGAGVAGPRPAVVEDTSDDPWSDAPPPPRAVPRLAAPWTAADAACLAARLDPIVESVGAPRFVVQGVALTLGDWTCPTVAGSVRLDALAARLRRAITASGRTSPVVVRCLAPAGTSSDAYYWWRFGTGATAHEDTEYEPGYGGAL
jgi:hypothetical protein